MMRKLSKIWRSKFNKKMKKFLNKKLHKKNQKPKLTNKKLRSQIINKGLSFFKITLV